MKLDTFNIQWWVIHLDWACEDIADIIEQNYNNNDADCSWDSIIKDIEEHKKTLMELVPSDTLSPCLYNKDSYPVELIGQYIISELREEMNRVDEIGRENVLAGCLTGSTLIQNYMRYNNLDYGYGQDAYSDWRKEVNNISPELSSFCHDAIEGAKWFAWSIGDLIAYFNLDPQRFAKPLSDKIEDIILTPSRDYSRKRKTTGTYLTVAQRTLAVKTLLEQVGICSSNTDKTKIAAFATAVMGRNMDLSPQNNPIYEAVRKENSDKDWEVVKKLFENIGLKDIANKLK